MKAFFRFVFMFSIDFSLLHEVEGKKNYYEWFSSRLQFHSNPTSEFKLFLSYSFIQSEIRFYSKRIKYFLSTPKNIREFIPLCSHFSRNSHNIMNGEKLLLCCAVKPQSNFRQCLISYKKFPKRKLLYLVLII